MWNLMRKFWLLPLAVIAVIALVLGGMLLSIVETCPKLDMQKSCTTETDCKEWFSDNPQAWLDQQRFECDDNHCFVTFSSCRDTWVDIE